jgi:hypothetical protein
VNAPRQAPLYDVRPVLAGAYRGRDLSKRPLRTHVAVLGADGYPTRTLCRRVEPENLADAEPAGAEPTCPACKERLAALPLLRGAR